MTTWKGHTLGPILACAYPYIEMIIKTLEQLILRSSWCIINVLIDVQENLYIFVKSWKCWIVPQRFISYSRVRICKNPIFIVLGKIG